MPMIFLRVSASSRMAQEKINIRIGAQPMIKEEWLTEV